MSHPKFMDALVALVPLARTPAWSIIATDATRQAISAIRPDSVTGHYAAGGFIPADVEVVNAEVGQFLDVVTQRGARLK